MKEQPLPPYGACLLGSLNLAKFVSNPFEGLRANGTEIKWDQLAEAVHTAVRMMDNVVDVSNFPLEAQREEAYAKRRIGLGVTGLADMLVMLGVKYGSNLALEITDDVLGFITNEAYYYSTVLAEEKGTFPLYDRDEYVKTPMFKSLDRDVQERIYKYGLRNALLTSIAPTGTISLFAGNVSSGLEPIFSFSYVRKVLEKDGSHREELVEDYAVMKFYEKFGRDAELPDYFVSAQTLKPLDHVRMQAVAQKWIDSSISKTVNCPEDISFEEFKDVYIEAYRSGCKGCTTYRPNDITGSVLSVADDSSGADDADAFGGACTLEVDPESGQLIRTCE